jgi:hypothetical protein
MFYLLSTCLVCIKLIQFLFTFTCIIHWFSVKSLLSYEGCKLQLGSLVSYILSLFVCMLIIFVFNAGLHRTTFLWYVLCLKVDLWLISHGSVLLSMPAKDNIDKGRRWCTGSTQWILCYAGGLVEYVAWLNTDKVCPATSRVICFMLSQFG